MKCICIKCEEELDVSKNKDIICPYCGNFIMEKKKYESLKEDLKKDNYTEEDLKEVLKNENNVYEKINGTALEKVKGYIYAMFQLLKDPTAKWTHKIIAIGALAYVISPLDLIPDAIPVIGYVDDAAAIFLAVGVLGSAIEKYSKEMDEQVHISNKTVLYRLKGITFPDETNLEQNKNLMIWNIPNSKKNKIRTKLITGKMMNLNEAYILSSSIGNYLVPVNNFDNYITDSIFNEATMILKAMGVKKIVCTKKIATTSDKKIAAKGEFKSIFEGEGDVKIKGVKIQEDKTESVFEKVDLSHSLKNTDFVDKLIWYFSDNSIISNTIFKERFIQGLSKTNIKRSIELSSILDVKSRINIRKYLEDKYKGNMNVNIIEGSNVQWNIEVEYYSLSDVERKTLEKIYNNIEERIEKRRKELEGNFNR